MEEPAPQPKRQAPPALGGNDWSRELERSYNAAGGSGVQRNPSRSHSSRSDGLRPELSPRTSRGGFGEDRIGIHDIAGVPVHACLPAC